MSLNADVDSLDRKSEVCEDISYGSHVLDYFNYNNFVLMSVTTQIQLTLVNLTSPDGQVCILFFIKLQT